MTPIRWRHRYRRRRRAAGTRRAVDCGPRPRGAAAAALIHRGIV